MNICPIFLQPEDLEILQPSFCHICQTVFSDTSMLNLTKSIHGNSRAESLFVACINFFIDGIKSAWQSGFLLPFLCQSHRLLVALDHFRKDKVALKLQYPSCIFQVTGLIFSPQKIKFTVCILA